ncbi:protein adenylyltransferase SelO [Echinimonas agarilytica]|uniref:Protein nucleotidyltransferase YdiU n=1 Tax=Echinimonas agarilytica TaxID=1215918 RepID=A0AA42B612_9GAMM|nr:YdiU family protein [Echinimonas agarilytica]
MQDWQFNNHWHDELPETYSEVMAMPIMRPKLVAYAEQVGSLLDLKQQPAESELCRYFSGASVLQGSAPLAQVYSGHQFGHYVPQLGDGRGLLLGQITNAQQQSWDLHLKGAGLTPYSRSGDGRAVLRSSIREFLASEAMHALGIPTSRALCVLDSETPVQREEMETAATVLRVSESHLRFGHFEYFFHTNRHGILKELADYALRHHFQSCLTAANPYLAMFEQVVIRTATLIAKWQSVGFTHGVMNTDNMSLLGLTFDYGPYGFMDKYEANHIPNHSDHSGRYSYVQQPGIGHWNLQCLAHALSPLVGKEDTDKALGLYELNLMREYSRLMAAKFGLDGIRDGDGPMMTEFFELIQRGRHDHTLSFRLLSEQDVRESRCALENEFIDLEGFRQWWGRYRKRRGEQDDATHGQSLMLASNPKYILRNHLAHTAIEKAKTGDYTEVQQLHSLLTKPFAEQPDMGHYAQLPPKWSDDLEVSCSS